jgi:hypothetical protein
MAIAFSDRERALRSERRTNPDILILHCRQHTGGGSRPPHDVEEKVTQLVNQSRAIPRLNIPDYDWWSEASHGDRHRGRLSFRIQLG